MLHGGGGEENFSTIIIAITTYTLMAEQHIRTALADAGPPAATGSAGKIGESIATRRPNTDVTHEGELVEWPLWLSAWSAAANGDVVGLLRLLEAQPGIANVTSTIGWTPLHFACARGHAKVVRMLLDRCAVAVADLTKGGATPLSLAIAGKHRKCAKLLLDRDQAGAAKVAALLEAARGEKDYLTMDLLMRWQARQDKAAAEKEATAAAAEGEGGAEETKQEGDGTKEGGPTADAAESGEEGATPSASLAAEDGEPEQQWVDGVYKIVGRVAPVAEGQEDGTGLLLLDPVVVDVLKGEIAAHLEGKTDWTREEVALWANPADGVAAVHPREHVAMSTTDVLQVLLHRARAERTAVSESYSTKRVGDWTPVEVGRWVMNSGLFELGSAAKDIDFAVRNARVSGYVVQALKKDELMALLRTLGVPPKHRKHIAVEMALLSDDDATERLKKTDARYLPVAIAPEGRHSACAEWRIVGGVEASLLTPLSAIRELIDADQYLRSLGALPATWAFLSPRKKRDPAVKREKEAATRVLDNGPLPVIVVQKEL